MEAELPETEVLRLDTLRDYAILDTLPEDAYDDITQLASEICGTSISAVSFVDSERQWFKSIVGLDVQETPREVAFCAHTILEKGLMIVPDARYDVRFADNPLVTGGPGIRFYAGAPLITKSGEALGTLCVIDSVRHDLTERQGSLLQALSRQVMAQLELRRHIARQDRRQLQVEEAHRRAEIASLTDDVSGFHNTRFMHQWLDERIGDDTAASTVLSLVFFDMDAFKAVVDEHGHLMGSQVLREVAQAVELELGLRDKIVRFGGDEYVVLLPDQGPDAARAVTQRVQAAIARTPFLHAEKLDLRVTASFGFASYPDDATDKRGLLAAADRALFRSKATGKNRVTRGGSRMLGARA